MKWNGPLVKEKYRIANQIGNVIKLVGKAEKMEDNFALYDFASRVNSSRTAKPLIAINTGLQGMTSRILNATFSPVSHPLLPFKAAPGQLSFAEIQRALHLMGQLQPRRFYLFGQPIAHSMSPTIHNAAFEALGLPHVYELMETTDVGEEIKATIASSDFGGASVTIPFKLDIIPLLDKLSPAAEALGAVNTIVPVATAPDGSGRMLYGDNTDWIAIRELVQSRLPSGTIEAALVLGAGGTARAAIYALHALGAQRIYIYNRTRSKAQALVHVFPDAGLEVLDGLDGVAPSVIVSTVPANATAADETAGDGGAVHLPSSLFGGRGVVVDMAYRPAETPLLALAARAGGERWSRVRGLDVLLEQGYEQFERWIGRRCPRAIVRKTVCEKYAM